MKWLRLIGVDLSQLKGERSEEDENKSDRVSTTSAPHESEGQEPN